jgi:hypothetical protein
LRRVTSSSATLCAVLLASALCVAPSAQGALPNEALICPEDPPEQDRYAYLRSLSLQLRGVPPTDAEYAVLDNEADVPEALIDEWLTSQSFADQVVRFHQGLLWNRLDVQLVAAAFSLRRDSGSLLYWRIQTATNYRGDQFACADTPVQYDPDTGAILTEEIDGVHYEGYRLINPYWAPDTTIKVCAFDAQEAEVGLSGLSCGTLTGRTDPSCGCGEDLRYCRYGATHNQVIDAMGRDVDMRIEAMILADEPYTALFDSPRAYINGPLADYLQHRTKVPATVRVDPLPVSDYTIPPLEWSDDTWVEVSLPQHHAGILTSPAFLMRFQTNRARATRFYDAFLCQPFTPPAAGLPLEEDNSPHPDLQQRAGCKYCHALLEPAAAHWGRWTENGAGYLDPEDFPAVREDCVQCAYEGLACGDDCNRFYHSKALSPEEHPYLGHLKAYVFRRDDHKAHVEAGPNYLVNRNLMDEDLPQCVTSRAVHWLLGRAPHEAEAEWIDLLASEFAASGYRYRDLVKAIVQSETYRRVR